MVRLKVLSEQRAVIMNKEFQFLMVRLKERRLYMNEFDKNISIPYGAIKRVL